MTLIDLLRALARRWPIVLIGAMATVGAAVLATPTQPIYYARTEMVFLAPPSTRYPNELVTQTESLIVTAGVVAKRINGADVRLKFGSPVVNPVGAPDNGERTWISLLDIGNQWVPYFNDQILIIDAIGSTPAKVGQRIEAASDLVQRELLALQNEQGADPVTFITARMSPAGPVIEEVSGSRARAAGMTMTVGGLLTLALVVVLEVRSRTPRDAGWFKPIRSARPRR